jgi:hypothetical protein
MPLSLQILASLLHGNLQFEVDEVYSETSLVGAE